MCHKWGLNEMLWLFYEKVLNSNFSVKLGYKMEKGQGRRGIWDEFWQKEFWTLGDVASIGIG